MNKAKRNKRITAICAAFMFALLSIFAVLATQNRTAYKMEVEYAAKAEEGNYKENYFSVENTFVTWNGLTFIWENGIGSVSGTLTKDVNEPYSFALTSTIPTYRYLYYRAFAQFSGMIVTGFALSAKRVGGLVADGYICTFPKFAENELYFINKNNAAVSCYFWIRGKSGDSVNIPFIYPRISDESLASYVPDTIQQRIEDSYKEGYKAASDDLSLGVLKNAKIDLSLMFSDGITEKKKTYSNLTPVFTYNGIDLSSYAGYEYDTSGDYYIETADVTITFAEAFSYSQFPIGFIGNSASDVYGGYFIGTDGKQYACERDVSVQGSAFELDEGKYPANLQVESLIIGFGRASDTLQGTVMVQSGQYLNGYTIGYNTGSVDGFDSGYNTGKKDGYSSGYNDGYSSGLQVSDGGFFNLITAVVDAPIKAFTGLLDFEILGVNMKSFVLSILTLALFVVIVRWVLGKA